MGDKVASISKIVLMLFICALMAILLMRITQMREQSTQRLLTNNDVLDQTVVAKSDIDTEIQMLGGDIKGTIKRMSTIDTDRNNLYKTEVFDGYTVTYNGATLDITNVDSVLTDTSVYKVAFDLKTKVVKIS